MPDHPNVVVLVGGVGGAKLVYGLAQILEAGSLTVIINTGDDFWHYGLRICPDIDTVTYTLAGAVNRANGWGVAEDTFTAMDTLRELGESPWFNLGDKDIATHLLRTGMWHAGLSLTAITAHLAQARGVRISLLPMTDTPVATKVETEELGELAFQSYFVEHRWQPTVRELWFAGVEDALMTPQVEAALANADILLIGPSNPWLSIAPILAVPGMREAILARDIPRVAVTPIVEGRAIKGPAAKLMEELGYEVSAQSVANYYRQLVDGFVYDQRDTSLQVEGLRTIAFDTLMVDDMRRIGLAQEILKWIKDWTL